MEISENAILSDMHKGNAQQNVYSILCWNESLKLCQTPGHPCLYLTQA